MAVGETALAFWDAIAQPCCGVKRYQPMNVKVLSKACAKLSADDLGI